MTGIWALLGVSVQGRRRSWSVVVVLLGIASTALDTGIAVRRGPSAAVNASRRLGGEHDVVLWGRADALRIASRDPAVLQAGRTRAISSVDVLGDDGPSLALLNEDVGPGEPFGRLLLESGRRAVAADEVVVERGLAGVGDRIRVRRDGRVRSLRVVGIGTDLLMCGAPTFRPGRLFVAASAFDEVIGVPAAEMEQAVALRLRPTTTSAQPTDHVAAVASRLTNESDRGIVRVIPWTQTLAALQAPGLVLGNLISAVATFLLVAALIVLASSTSARLAARRGELATYATLGASPRSLLGLLFAETLASALLASVIGWLGAAFLAPWSWATLTGVGTTDARREALRLTDLALGTGIVLAGVTVATLWSVRRASSTSVVEQLRNRPAAGRPRWRWTFALGGTAVPLGLQDPATRPVRSMLAGFGLVVATTAAVVGIGVTSTVDRLIDPSTRPTPRRDVTLWATDGRTTDELVRAVALLDFVAAVATERIDAASVVGSELPVRAYAQGGPIGKDLVPIVEGRGIRDPDEALIGYGILRRNGTRIGDSVVIRVEGREVRLRVVGTFRDVADSGNAIRFRIEALRAVGGGSGAGSVYAVGSPGVSAMELRRAVAAVLGPGVQVFATGDPTPISRRARTVILLTVGLVFVVAVVQMASSALVTLREQRRELTMLGVLGATVRNHVLRGATSGGVVGVLGAVVGLPVGVVVLHTIGRVGLGRTGLGPGLVQTPSAAVLASVGLGALVASVVSSAAVHAAVGARLDTFGLRLS